MPDRIALREKDFGIWQEVTLGRLLGLRRAGRARAAGAGYRAGRPGRGALGEPPRVAVLRRRRNRGAGHHRRPVPDQSGPAEVAYLLSHSGARVLIAEDQEQVDKALEVLDQLPDLEKIIYLEPRGIRYRYTEPKLMSWERLPCPRRRHRESDPDAVTAGWPRPPRTIVIRSSTPRAPPGRPRARCSRCPTWSSASRCSSRAAGSPLPRHRPRDVIAVLPAAVPRRGAGLHHLVLARAPAFRCISPSRSRPCRPTCARCSRRSCSACRASGRRCSPACRSGSTRRPGSSACSAGSGCGRPTASPRPWCAPAAGTPRVPGCVYAIGWVLLLPGSAGPDRHAQGPLRDVGRRPDRARGAAVLHGHRGADARGVRDDREHRDRYRQPAGPGEARHGRRAARRHRAAHRRGTGEILTRHPGTFAGYWKNPEATARTIDADGWLHTGDVGEWVDGTTCKITDRMKDIIITAGGKNVVAVGDRERAQGLAVHQGGHRDRRPARRISPRSSGSSSTPSATGRSAQAALHHVPRPRREERGARARPVASWTK